MLRNRMRIAKNLFYKGQDVEFQFKSMKIMSGGSGFDRTPWYKIPGAFVINHDFRSWRPWENLNDTEGDRLEGYAQLQISIYDLKKFENEHGVKLDKDTKVRFQDQIYSIQGWDQFVQRDAMMYDLKRLPYGGS